MFIGGPDPGTAEDLVRYREIPGTGVRVSEIGFGADPLASGWWGDKGDDEAIRLLHAALGRGVTLFDTADVDGDGRVESILGRAFRDRRDQVVYLTKGGYDWMSAQPRARAARDVPRDFRPAYIRQALTASLRRLATDRIDIYELHHPAWRHLDDTIFEALESLVTEGLIRTYGVALSPDLRAGEGRRIVRSRRVPVLDLELSLMQHEPWVQIAALASAAGTGVIARRPHSWGLLEGKYSPQTTFPPGDPRSHLTREWLGEGLRKVDALSFLCDGRPWTLAQAALKWALAQPGVITAVPTIHSEKQLAEFAAAPDLPDLEPDDLARIADLLASGFAHAPADAAQVPVATDAADHADASAR